MNRAVTAYRIQSAERKATWLAAPLIAAGTIVVLVTIVAILTAQGLVPGTPGSGASFRSEGMLIGYLISVGVVSLTSSFPLASAVGITRRDFALGTALYFTQMALYVTALITVLTMAEQATGGWFLGARVFDSPTLGNGDLAVMAWLLPLGAFATMSLGACFGAAWLWRRMAGLALPISVLIGVSIGALWVLGTQWLWIAANFQLWWVAIILAALGAAALAGSSGLLRRTSVRGS